MKWKSWLRVIVINLVIIEIISYLALWILGSQSLFYYPITSVHEFHRERIQKFVDDGYTYDEYSPEYGWRIKENGVARAFGRHYQSNNQGLRSNRSYTEIPDSGIVRISTFGDSFTHGDDVFNDQTWQYFLEQQDSTLEVLNFGIGGFGTDQAYLRYLHDGKAYETDVVMIGFTLDNMLRNVNVYRPFYAVNTRKPFTKPRFELEKDSLILIKNPNQKIEDYLYLLENPKYVLSEIGETDFWYQKRNKSTTFDFIATVRLTKLIVNVTSIIRYGFVYDSDLLEKEYFQVTEALLKEFYDQVEEDGAIPVIILFPNNFDFVQHKWFGKRHSELLVSRLQESGYRVIDLWTIYEDNNFDSSEIMNPKGGHYSPDGNLKVAEFLYQYLNTEFILEKHK